MTRCAIHRRDKTGTAHNVISPRMGMFNDLAADYPVLALADNGNDGNPALYRIGGLGVSDRDWETYPF